MGIDLSENGEGFNDLKEHIGHEIVIQPYGDYNDPTNIAIECETCGCVLVDFDKPEKVGVPK
jgi:hypothetical protein